jgi:serine/threonine protein kinase
MAPEVIENKWYDGKADVFSFSIVLWELLTGKPPYIDILVARNAAIAVLEDDRRPALPVRGPQELSDLMQECWSYDPQARPTFEEIRVSVLVMSWLHDGQSVAEPGWFQYPLYQHLLPNQQAHLGLLGIVSSVGRPVVSRGTI